MKNIIIYTPYDCLIKTKTEQNLLEKNQHLILENYNAQKISVYPIGKSSKYSFNINISEQKDSNLYSIIEKDENLLVFLLDGLIAENIKIYNFTFQNKRSSIEVSSQKIVFSTENNKKIIRLPNESKNFICGNFNHIIYAKFSDSYNEKIIAYNTLTNHAKMFSGDNININNNGFIIKNNSSTSYQNIQSEYFIDNQGLKVKSKSLIPSDRFLPEDLISYNFMESIKNNDYKNALSYLSENLQSKINETTLKNYFGDISYFYTIDKNSCFAISDNKNILYDFSILNNKINEITDNQQ